MIEICPKETILGNDNYSLSELFISFTLELLLALPAATNPLFLSISLRRTRLPGYHNLKTLESNFALGAGAPGVHVERYDMYFCFLETSNRDRHRT